MAETTAPRSIIESLGEEIVRIVTPVSICMFLVVILVSLLNSDSSSSLSSSIATIAYTENTSDSTWNKFEGALLNSLVFVAVVTVATFFLVFLFYIGCTKFLKYYMGFSAFLVLGFMGGEIALFLIQDLSFPIDCLTFGLVLFNSTVVGVLAVFMSKMPIFLTQAYLVVIGMLVAYWFTLLPEWTTWFLLIAMALYDLAAVLLPVGPLKILVELAMSRDEDIPALVYEARPVTSVTPRRVWREISNGETSLFQAEEGQLRGDDTMLNAPLMETRISREDVGLRDNVALEGIGLGSGGIKLGLGDFIFYSVLVGRAAMYDFMTVYACYLAIVAGLGITLLLLAFHQKVLPALPVSIALGVLFYFLTRLLLEAFVVQCSVHLLMF